MTKKYQKLLEVADKICNVIKGKPKTHSEWANKFNDKAKVARIIRIDKHG